MKILLAKLSLIVIAAASAVGCARTNLQPRLDGLTREREELQRRNMQLEGQLAASEARATAWSGSCRRSAPPRRRAPTWSSRRA